MSFGWSTEVGVLNPSGQLLDTANFKMMVVGDKVQRTYRRKEEIR